MRLTHARVRLVLGWQGEEDLGGRVRVSLLTVGSRGDVGPFLALALGMQAAGHFLATLTPGNRTTAFPDIGAPELKLGGNN